MMKIHIYIPVLLFATLLFATSCQDKVPEEASAKKQILTEELVQNSEENPSVTSGETTEDNIINISQSKFNEFNMMLGAAGLEHIDETINAAGYIEVPSENKAEVRSYIGGYLQSTPLLPGDYVNKGQFLISLENLEYIQLQQNYLNAQDKLAFLKAAYDRKNILAEEKITSLSIKQQAESEYKSAMANYEGLRKMLQMINIDPDKVHPETISSSINLYAPKSGYITMVNAVKGKYAEPTDIIFEIFDTSHLHLELKVYEKDILKVKKGQKIAFSVPEANSKSYTAEVFLVGKTIDESDRTVSVHCHIDERSEIPVVVGMYVEAEIYIESNEKFCLPVSALVREEGDYYVFVNTLASDDGYRFEKILVDVGEMNEDCAEIVGESRQQLEGKEMLIEGAFNL